MSGTYLSASLMSWGEMIALGPDNIELDADFHRRFAELMNRVCGPSQYYQKADPFPHSSDVGTYRRFLH